MKKSERDEMLREIRDLLRALVGQTVAVPITGRPAQPWTVPSDRTAPAVRWDVLSGPQVWS